MLDRSQAATTVEEFVAHDIAFHLRIVEAVDNPVLSMLLRVLSTRTPRVRIVRGSRTRDALDNAHQDHEQILGARCSPATPCWPPAPRRSTSRPWSSGWPPV
ncbi:FCD domain-containing protein [Streptomyces sp. NPDC048550]|uniref:FCD domain-containing protein n=1 Tax=unclassified Streptomyces TaxID=2593676 RepID=UPI00341CA52A